MARYCVEEFAVRPLVNAVHHHPLSSISIMSQFTVSQIYFALTTTRRHHRFNCAMVQSRPHVPRYFMAQYQVFGLEMGHHVAHGTTSTLNSSRRRGCLQQEADGRSSTQYWHCPVAADGDEIVWQTSLQFL